MSERGSSAAEDMCIHTVHRKGIEMADKNEEISIPASSADHFERRSFSGPEILCASRPALTAKERGIAIAAVSARASGAPVEAAKQILAGIAVLDGNHMPIVVWPENTTLRQKADWLATAASDQSERADQFDARMRQLNPGAPQAPEVHPGDAQVSSELAPTLLPSTSYASAHLEEETDSRPLKGPRALKGSNDAC